MHKARGFTLIELSVAIFIIAILATAITSAMGSLVVQSREKATRANQDAIKAALSSFLLRNSRLPCPAIRTTVSGTAGNGVEAITPGTCTGTITAGAAPNVVVTGAVPWASLGLAEDTSLDGYGHRFTYQVMANATNLTAGTVAGMLGSISIHSAGPGVLPPNPGANQTNNCATATYNPCGAVAVIVSHGANGYGAFNSSGQQVPVLAGATDEPANTDGDSRFVMKSYSDIAANPYDDIVMAITADQFLAPLTGSGSLKPYQTDLNEKMNVIKGAVIANAFANSDMPGGARRYRFPAALPALPPAQLIDAWGTPILYARITADVLCSTAPATDTVFTLTSLGQNPNAGVTADDITVTVTVAEIIAIISKAGCNA